LAALAGRFVLGRPGQKFTLWHAAPPPAAPGPRE
jgi:hypothetical protein